MDPKMAEQKKELINKVARDTKFGKWPYLWAAEQIGYLYDQYENNLRPWKRTILHFGNAYTTAFNQYNNIIQMDKKDSALRKALVANIVGLLTGSGLAWLGSGKVLSRMAFGRAFKDQGAAVTAFFSSDFNNALKDFMTDAVKKKVGDVTADVLTGKINELNQSHVDPKIFQNQIEDSFLACHDAVLTYLNDLSKALRSLNEDERTSLESSKDNLFVRDGISSEIKYGYTANAQLDFIKKQLNKQHDRALDFVKKMNEHLIQNCFYFREAPSLDAEKDFIKKMSFRIERGMWASWIPICVLKTRVDPLTLTPVGVAEKSIRYTGKLPDDFNWRDPTQLQTLQEGYWLQFRSIPHNYNEIQVLKVLKTTRTPGRVIKKRLAELGITKGGKDPKSIPLKLETKIEKLGWVTTEKQLKDLISWAKKYTASNGASHLVEYPHKTRSTDDLTITATKKLIDVKSIC